MTGAELQGHRKAAQLSQIALARLAGVGRHAVQYWERQAVVRPWQHAPQRMLKALGLPDNATSNARARGWGLSRRDDWRERIDRAAEAQMARQRARVEARLAELKARARVPCGARTRKGQPCRLLSEAGRTRCKFHGGRSTGPRTPEGRARIAEAQRRRWAARRALKAPSDLRRRFASRPPLRGWRGHQAASTSSSKPSARDRSADTT